MTKQGDIREGMNWLVLHAKPEEGQDIGGILMKYLHSQGVAIKVDRELPKLRPGMFPQIGACASDGYLKGINDMADRVAVEPLIKEVNNECK